MFREDMELTDGSALTLEVLSTLGQGGQVCKPKMTHVAIFGGTFDPPHLGTSRVVNALYQSNLVDYVYICPTGQNPLKAQAKVPFEHRVKMCQIMFPENSFASIRTLPYQTTVQLLSDLGVTDGKDHVKYSLTISSDLLEQIMRWTSITDVLAQCDFIVYERPGYPCEQFLSTLPSYVVAKMTFLKTSNVENVSSTQIRELLAQNDDALLAPLLDEHVLEYIRRFGLYR